MRGHKRKFKQDSFQHVFQHALGYRVVFYSLEDRLVFYTIFSVQARRYDMSVLALALMYNHFHTLISSGTSRIMSLFIGTVTSTFAKAFNRDMGRKGPLFEKAYGSAPKSAEKRIRTTIAYCYNNSVEKRLFTRAEEDRWNFLAYLVNDHPFSPPIIMEKASKHLRGALKEVDAHVRDGAYLNYACIRRMYKTLSDKEKEQLTDYIISGYIPIDKTTLLSFYKDYDSMVLAINSNTGSEYEIKEEFKNDSDQAYTQMLEIIEHSSFSSKPHSIIMASSEKKREIMTQLNRKTDAKNYQIARLLHLDDCPASG